MINIKTNSKLVKPGDTFVAIKGHTVDGHNYIESAIENGATKVIVQNKKKYNVKTKNVKDTTKYLNDYLVKHYAKEFKDLKIVGLTGTNGKTTTAFMTYSLLTKINIKAAYVGTIGFFYGKKHESTLNTTPDILALYNFILKAKEEGCKIIILEASSIGLVEGRMNGLKFDIAAFTNLTHDHLDYHKNMKSYLKAKEILFDNLKKSGISIINIDDKYGKHFYRKHNLTYSFKDGDIKCVVHDNAYSKFTYTLNNQNYEISTPLYGKYNIYNVMASILILYTLGIDIDLINKTYAKLDAPVGRMNIIKYKTNKIIVDYAHTPDGIKQVLNTASNLEHNNIYVVFGCPGNRDRLKRPLMTKEVDKVANKYILTNDDPHYEDEMQIINDALKGIESKKYKIILDRKKAIKTAFNMLKENDILLILGKGHEDAIIIKNERIPHNDTNYVNELIKNS